MPDDIPLERLARGDLPENAECRHELVGGMNGIQLSSSVIQTKGRCEWQSTSLEGLSLGIARGQMSFDLGRRWKSELRGSYGFCLSTAEPIESHHVIDREARLQAVVLHLAPAALDELRIRPGDLHLPTASQPGVPAGASFRNWTPHLKTAVLARQIAGCPYRGPLRTLYLQGKSLELLATMLDDLARAGTGADWRRPRLSPRDVERLTHARDLLIESLDSPPSLDALARQVGMSTSRLTAGFRKMFEMSVTAFVQERRLDRALSAIADGGVTVAQAAYSVGYSPAYFSTLFRRRFGFPPSALSTR